MLKEADLHGKLRKPVISNKLPKAFSQPKIPKGKEIEAKLPEHEYRKVKNLLSPLQREQSIESKISRNLHKLSRFSTVHEAPHPYPAALVSRVPQQELIVLETLSSSSSGVIKKTLHATSLKLYVTNEIPINTLASRQAVKETLKKWQHSQKEVAGLVRVNSVYWNSPEGWVKVLLDYLPGRSLKSLCEHIGVLPEHLLKQIFSRVLKTLYKFHKKVGPHGGLDTAQIFFTKTREVQLGPGLFEQLAKPKCSVSQDVFDIGCSLLTACMGNMPLNYSYGKENECCLYQSLATRSENIFLSKVSVELRDLLCKLTQFDSAQRPTVREALKHPWFSATAHSIRVTLLDLLKISAFCIPPDPEETQLNALVQALSWVIPGQQLEFKASPDAVSALASDLGVPPETVYEKLANL